MERCVLLLIASVCGVCLSLRPPDCPEPELCKGRIPPICPSQIAIQGCSTCCCQSSANVEFYDQSKPEPTCTAPPAVFDAKFVGTWTATCHPTYYFPSAHWSWPTGISHQPEYELWDACMKNVSRGVATVSQTGSTSIIKSEYAAQGDAVLDSFEGSVIAGADETSRELDIDSAHQYVSVVTMLAPSVDQMMGVSSLRLCNGSDWKKSVKICGELFSTATKSERVSDGRNSIQGRNCSFGYFEFTFLRYKSPLPSEFPPEDSPDCQSRAAPTCPAKSPFPEDNCGTCCCLNKGDVDFYNPHGDNTVCAEGSDAEYIMSFKPSWTEVCHPDFYHFRAGWSEASGVSHKDSYELWNRCYRNVSDGISDFSTTGNVEILQLEYEDAGDEIRDTFYTSILEDGKGESKASFEVDARHSYVSALVKQNPSADLVLGVSRLQLCGKEGWKDAVRVCAELFSTGEASSGSGFSNVQYNNCSFGAFLFRKKPVSKPTFPKEPSDVPREKFLPDVKARELTANHCCAAEFIFQGRVVKVAPLDDPVYAYRVYYAILETYYDTLGFFQDDTTVAVKVVNPPEDFGKTGKIERKQTHVVMGQFECVTHDPIVDKDGYIRTGRAGHHHLQAYRCMDHIYSKACS